MFKSIRIKFLAIISLAILLTILVFAYIAGDFNKRIISRITEHGYAVIKREIHSEWEKKAHAVLSLLSHKLIQPLHTFDISEIENVLDSASKEDDIVYIFIQDAEGRVIHAYLKADEGKRYGLIGRILDSGFLKNAVSAENILAQKQGDIIDISSPVMLGQTKLAVIRMGLSEKGIKERTDNAVNHFTKDADDAKASARNKMIFASIIIITLATGLALLLVQGLLKPIYIMIDGAKKVSEGDLSYRIKVDSNDEIKELSDNFNQMTESIERHDNEKTMMIQDMHDGIGGIFTNIRLLAELPLNQAQGHYKKNVSIIKELSEEGLSEVRTLMYGLDAGKKDLRAITGDIRHLGNSLLKPYGISFNMQDLVWDGNKHINAVLQINLFRIYREAMTNIIKHSGAKRVDVYFSAMNEKLTLIVKDDGIGLNDKDKRKNGRGLSNMKKRAMEIGGDLKIDSDNGTSVKLEASLSKKYPDGANSRL